MVKMFLHLFPVSSTYLLKDLWGLTFYVSILDIFFFFPQEFLEIKTMSQGEKKTNQLCLQYRQEYRSHLLSILRNSGGHCDNVTTSLGVRKPGLYSLLSQRTKTTLKRLSPILHLPLCKRITFLLSSPTFLLPSRFYNLEEKVFDWMYGDLVPISNQIINLLSAFGRIILPGIHPSVK